MWKTDVEVLDSYSVMAFYLFGYYFILVNPSPTQPRPRVFHCITSLQQGGTETHLLGICRALQNEYAFTIGYLKQPGPIADELIKAGFPVQRVAGFSNLYRVLRQGKYNLLHTHLYRANLYGRLAGRLAGVPVIVSSQQSIDLWKKKTACLVRPLERAFL